MSVTTDHADVLREMFAVPAPTEADFNDPHGRMTLRQLAVVVSTVIEPGDESVHDHDYADLVADLVAGIAGDRFQPRFSRAGIDRVFKQIETLGIHVLVRGDSAWPSYHFDRLGKAAPIVLYARGNPFLLTDQTIVGMVGARAATGYGEHVASTMASELVDHGATIVSGGAYGIDGMVHRAALASGGRTICFVAGGVDRYYPMGHESLLQRIAETGVVISEVPPGSAPTKWRFLQRNRLIAAASHAVIVVEAGVRSGSLNTASHAKALGIPLGAVPGPITSPASAGCHRLLREFDAVCVTGYDDIAQMLVTEGGQ